MKFYLAPMEGITGFIYRNAYKKYFDNIDKYYTPFIIPNKSKSFKTKELRDILPENNENIKIVPQILTNDSELFIFTASKLKELGYKEVNLNLGCPSGTVVSKGRGSGFLAKREELDRFLDEIYTMEDINISIKTRIGKDSAEEFFELLKIYNQYPIEELTIHPRTQKDFYKNEPNLEIFEQALDISKNPICYNGDIFSKEAFENIKTRFPNIDKVMLGRGIFANPGLIEEIKNDIVVNKYIVKDFHDEILENYIELLSGDKNVLFKMKELWAYMIYIFSNNKKYAKSIRKSQKLNDYKSIVSSLFINEDIVKGESLFK